MDCFGLLAIYILYNFNHVTESVAFESELTFLPCNGMAMTLESGSYSEISRVECSARCLVARNCLAFRFKGSICHIEIDGLATETTVPADDGCFATKGMSSALKVIVSEGG